MHFKLAFDPAIEVDYYSFQRGIEAVGRFEKIKQIIFRMFHLSNGQMIV